MLLGGLLINSLTALLVPLATGPLLLVLAMLAASQLLGDGASTIYEINQLSLIQAITPDHLQGRINASVRFIEWAAMLLGLLIGGLLGQTIGLRPTLFVAVIGGLLSGLWVLFSPVRRLHAYPTPLAEPADALTLTDKGAFS